MYTNTLGWALPFHVQGRHSHLGSFPPTLSGLRSRKMSLYDRQPVRLNMAPHLRARLWLVQFGMHRTAIP